MTETEKKDIESREKEILQKKLDNINSRKNGYIEKIKEVKSSAPELMEHFDSAVDPGTEKLRILFAKMEMFTEAKEEIEEMMDSPYFSKCLYKLKNSDEWKELFIGKHSLIKEGIVSWISPISRIRFEQVGQMSYKKPDGSFRYGEIKEKLNYIITNSEIVYLTYENKENGKQLIFHKHISERKQFALPEIIAQLEDAQDKIIRSDPKGGFLISGPAGSGKTTLALHRIAYLIQSPEFEEFFQPEDIIVFVADEKAVKYFSLLLLELGIKTAKVTTFLEWGINIFNQQHNVRYKPLNNERALSILDSEMGINIDVRTRNILDEIRRIKLEVLKNCDLESLNVDLLFQMYKKYEISNSFKQIYLEFIDNQIEDKLLDEVDIAALITSENVYKRVYSHIVVDEVQNWLPMQLDIMQKLIDEKYKSVTFVGDIEQRTKSFCIRNWKELKSQSPISNTITLTKVYRNTKEVLEWLEKQKYTVDASLVEKKGPQVEEISFKTRGEQNNYVINELNKLVSEKYEGQVGILTKFEEDFEVYKNIIWPENFHFLTVENSQGMEFDTVYFTNAQDFKFDYSILSSLLSPELANELKMVDRQLFFVAATRAQQKLVVTALQ